MKQPVLFLAAALVAIAAGAAHAAPVQVPAYQTAYVGQDVAASDAPGNGALAYAAGGYFYGSDCGGNAVRTAAIGRRAGAVAGVILGGAGGNSIAGALNCDDRRQALSAFRDSFEGKSGQQYDWRNSNGGSSGSVTPLRQYSRDGYACRDFQAVTIVDQHATSTKGTACRQQDGNWHFL